MSTPLRHNLIEDLQLHGLPSRTQAVYVVAVRQLADHFRKSPDQIREDELRQYFLYLSQVRKVSSSTFQIALSAIKFFYVYTLQRQWATLELVRPAREQKLPAVLSVAEVGRVLACVHRGKGSKERYVPLPVSLLELLRRHWSSHHHSQWLFLDSRWEGGSSAAPAGPVYHRGVQRAFKFALGESGILKEATVHTLRLRMPPICSKPG